MDVQAVLDHHLAAFKAGDADELIKDFTEQSVMVTPDGVDKGREAIRAHYSKQFAEMFRPGTYEFTVDIMQIEGDVAYAIWHAECASATIPFATDTWVIRDGKIVVLTYAGKIEPK